MSIETPVLIIGGGPVGLTLAAELGWRGQACMLIEERTAPTEHPKATLLGARVSTISQHLSLLRREGLVRARREAQTIHYRITDPAAVKVVETLAAIFCPEKPTPLRKKS